ncbi:ribosomal-protein-alanine acetyltransferase [Haloprofundus marisrubri]|uniref:Ribosomal-protein-alanine acetyltransferase n=1 Tax=Haloprofundus marisrubri TaxID=1514971 RepID=A0A0W1R5V2_9EURY|nr:GNAT family N-acetyltransferase [Haloprofundus marisrubri]KTG08811.1 ribosomal-protein-alanine acetyltransferase [Haloprofundus marisrubri]
MTTAPADAEGTTVRRAERADLLDVFRIEKTCFKQPWPFAAFEQFLGEPGFLVAVEGVSQSGQGDGSAERVVGYVVADVTPNYGRDIGHVKDIAVHPDARGRGLGRMLLQQSLVSMTLGGAKLVKLEVREHNDPAKALYESEGFEPLRRIPRYYEDGEAALVMVVDGDEWQRSGDEA